MRSARQYLTLVKPEPPLIIIPDVKLDYLADQFLMALDDSPHKADFPSFEQELVERGYGE